MRKPLALVLVPTFLLACATDAPREGGGTGETSDAISPVTVLCTANATQISLASTGATAAVAGYLVAAAIAFEGVVASGPQLASFGQTLYLAAAEVSGVGAQAQALQIALAAGSVKEIAVTCGALIAAVAGSGKAKALLNVGFTVLVAVKDGLITLDRWNPIGIAKNLDYLTDGLHTACTQCGEQWACPRDVTATTLPDHDFTKPGSNDSPPIAQGRLCARDVTFWSTERYLTQCFECCADEGYKTPASPGYHSCRAVCNAAHQ